MTEPDDIQQVGARIERAIAAATAAKEVGDNFSESAGHALKELILFSSRLVAAQLVRTKGIESLEGFPEYVVHHAEVDAADISDLLAEADAAAREAILLYGSALEPER